MISLDQIDDMSDSEIIVAFMELSVRNIQLVEEYLEIELEGEIEEYVKNIEEYKASEMIDHFRMVNELWEMACDSKYEQGPECDNDR